MADQLPSGRWRGRVRDPRTGKQVTPHTIIGGSKTYASAREAERAEDTARDALYESAARGATVHEWWATWTTDPLWLRPAESTNLHNAERTRAFAAAYGERPLRAIDHLVVAEWLKGGRNLGTVPALRAMFNDARKPHAGMLIDRNPFAGLGLEQTKGRKHVQPPAPGEVARLIAAADELTPPSFAAYLFTACYSAMRPGELDALQVDDLDFTPGNETILVARQWNVKTGKLTLPKHGVIAKIAMVEPLRERLLALPRERAGRSRRCAATTTCRARATITGTASAPPSASATSRCTSAPATTSPGTCSTSPSSPITSSRSSSATRTAARSCASSTGTPTPRSRASASEPRSATTAAVAALPVSHEMSHGAARRTA